MNDDLDPIKGIFWGLLLAAPLWGVLLMIAYVLWH